MPEQNDKNQKAISLEELKEKVRNNNFQYEDFENYYKQMREKEKEFLSLLEWVCQSKRDDKNLQRLLQRSSLESVSNLMEDLKNLGYGVQKDLGEDFAKMGYRLLEQVRAGKTSDVMYGISRIFITHQRNLPDILNEAFKPYYDVETFKCLLYAFLSAAIKPERKSKQEA
ncbi:hypothetical protein [Treponema sp. J25]|uniref:hypothetical protein n=1 Tax=Treponema sp. J25 TaxID=2094121 RepID=UPI0010503799|nr:hypothetical protein [Treponema sp. J25]NPV38764.1 hypothetical protein [Brevinematales bacterium]TCW62206.1 hypothetical protein C5O22_02360 [Treponema sp. J25]